MSVAAEGRDGGAVLCLKCRVQGGKCIMRCTLLLLLLEQSLGCLP